MWVNNEILPAIRFQFPTGWNSTLSMLIASLPSAVSIPNGMEFYFSRYAHKHTQSSFQFPTGWNSTSRYLLVVAAHFSFNSQRDGILLCAVLLPSQFVLFQFPTGWNSTVIWFCCALVLLSFNSQRDGILQNDKLLNRSAWGVSIPNGMEFY